MLYFESPPKQPIIGTHEKDELKKGFTALLKEIAKSGRATWADDPCAEDTVGNRTNSRRRGGKDATAMVALVQRGWGFIAFCPLGYSTKNHLTNYGWYPRWEVWGGEVRWCEGACGGRGEIYRWKASNEELDLAISALTVAFDGGPLTFSFVADLLAGKTNELVPMMGERGWEW